MIIREKLGTLTSFDIGARTIDHLCLEWFEKGKRILHKRTAQGREVILKFLKERPELQQDDVLYEDDHCLIVVQIEPCDVLVIQPKTMYEMALACYEIGNKHLPLFFQDDELLIPYEAPLHRMLQALGFQCEVQVRRLLYQLKTTVSPHAHTGSGSLFSKILQFTNASSNE
ncbi:urease accessory protein UreE [Chitinophagaceae bacterium LB-8]|uniref:Urease accessory protein UreE n=1 Tax=Paraflavisolibacter caeni TaxID=2982496 RepID=A0A9X2XVZ1_9BACT|nr:urease accessory protein UreE [Paraflavisolibacter caeni]MCU7549627.1 urease accessory protein UreE [Paraflavisolibacter caeni]